MSIGRAAAWTGLYFCKEHDKGRGFLFNFKKGAHCGSTPGHKITLTYSGHACRPNEAQFSIISSIKPKTKNMN